jgi:hypothetical protein
VTVGKFQKVGEIIPSSPVCVFGLLSKCLLEDSFIVYLNQKKGVSEVLDAS